MNELLRRKRVALGLSQIDLAKLAGVAERTIQYAESGHAVRRTTAKKIAAALGVPYEEIFPPEVRAFGRLSAA